MIFAHPSFRDALAPLGWRDYTAVARHFLGDDFRRRSRVIVRRALLRLPDRELDVFFKHYEYKSHWWGALGFQSKARREYRNYEVFGQLGVPSAAPLAWGEERDRLGFLRRGFILTGAIPDAASLVDWVAGQGTPPFPTNVRSERRSVLRQVAEMTRRIHGAEFFHNDLVWRNILVTGSGEDVRVWWIDCPRGRFSHSVFLRRGLLLKDLAALDKRGSQHCSATERLAFLKAYLGIPKLTPSAKKLARDCARFRRRRWPEDWSGR